MCDLILHFMPSQTSITKFIREYKYPLALLLFLRAWTVLWATLSILWWRVPVEDNARFYYGAPPLADAISSPWQRWDSIWYTKIAEYGYAPDDLSTAFFPLYPLVIRAITALIPLNSIAAGLIVSTIAALVAFVLFYQLACLNAGESVARRALAYLATYPLAFILFAAYPESLFLALVLGAWLCARKSKWALAGILGGLAGLTRAQGMLLILPLAYIFFEQYRERKVSITRAAWLLPIVGGAMLYLLYLVQLAGSPLAWLSVENNWLRSAMPWESLGAGILTLFQNNDPGILFFAWLDIASVVLFFVLLIWNARRGQWAEAIYLAIILIPPLFTITRYHPALPLAPLPRYLVLAFPGFTALGRINLRAPWLLLIAALSLLIQTVLLIAFAHWVFIA